jgi:hypothetical protein
MSCRIGNAPTVSGDDTTRTLSVGIRDDTWMSAVYR